MFYPWRTFEAQTIRQFKLPLWNHQILAGTPFLANGSSAIFYPPNFLYYVLPVPVAWSIRLMLQIILAGCFMSIFVRAIGGSLVGSVAAGVIYSFSGYLTSWRAWNHVDAAVWLPLMLFSVDWLLRFGGFRAVVLMSFSFAMPVLAGHPETAIHVTLAALAYAVFRMALLARDRPKDVTHRVALLGIVAVLAFGLAAAQLIPTWKWVPDITHQEGINWPHPQADQLLGVFSRDNRANPNSAGVSIPESAAYVGMLGLLLAFLAPLHRNKREILFFAILAACALQLILGWGPLEWIAQHTPVVQSLKRGRLWVVLDFSLAVLAGLGLCGLQSVDFKKTERRRRALVWALAGVGLGVVSIGCFVLFRHTTSPVNWPRSPQASITLLVVSAALVAGRLTERISQRGFTFAATALLTLDLVTFSYGYIPFSDVTKIFPPSPVTEFLRANQAAGYRVAALDQTSGPNFEMMYGLSSPAGFDLTLKRIKSFLNDFSEDMLDGVSLKATRVATTRDRRLDLLSVKYLLATRHNGSFAALVDQSDRFSLAYSSGSVGVFENKTVLPRALVVPAQGIQVVADDEQLDQLRDPLFDPERYVLLSKPVQRFHGVEGRADRSRMITVQEAPNALLLQAEAKEPSILVASQTYYPGWEVFVDDHPATLLRVDHVFTGVALQPGSHRVSFVFKPASVRIGVALTLATLSGICAASLIYGGRSRKRSRSWFRWLAPVPATIALGAVVLAVSTPSDRGDDSTVSAGNTADSARLTGAPLLLSLDNSGDTVTGYASIEPDSSATAVGGVSIIDYRHATEAVIPASTPGKTFVIPVHFDRDLRSAVVLTNTSTETATVSFSFPQTGEAGSLTLGARRQLSVFVDDTPFKVRSFEGIGTAVLKSTAPISVAAVTTSNGQNSEFRMAAVPAANSGLHQCGSKYLPYKLENAAFAKLELVNATDVPLTGRHRWFDEYGHLRQELPYAIQPQKAFQYDSPIGTGTGWVEIAPDVSCAVPFAGILLLGQEGQHWYVMSAVPEQTAATESTIYVERSVQVDTSVLIANPSSFATVVELKAYSSNQRMSISPHTAVTANPRLLKSALMHVSASSPVAASAIRQRSVRGISTLLSSVPPLTLTKGFAVFPDLATGGLFGTSLVTWTDSGSASGRLQFFDSKGSPLPLRVGVKP
jgi:hypothetical protein